jgi:O-antigen/teichoic acid export membrane protein
MSEHKDSYRSVMKATSLFGGVQVFNILIAIVRSKFIALFIGPAGMGIASLLNSTLGLINGVSNLGLDRSAVKDISFAQENENEKDVSRTISVLKRLVWFTACFGALLMIVTSPWLSEFAFDSKDFTWSFIWISIALLFKQFTSSQLAILQGLRKLKDLAKANLFGNFLGLFITVPLYYFYRIDAIVPAIIISALISFVFTFYYSNKVELVKTPIRTSEAFSEGKEMIHLGVMLSISSMISLLVAYIIQIYISQRGGVDEVGLYNAGFVILNTYVGIIFTAMATDYFPRLAGIAQEIIKIRKAVFEQAFIAILLITPIIVVFLMFAQFIIVLLYSSDFTPIVKMVSWGILGMVFKAVSFSMGYIIIAKGDSKLFIKTAIAFNSLLLISNVIGYYYGGLEGLGVSFFLYYIVHFVSLRIITKYRYEFYFEKGFYKVFIICVGLCVTAFLLTYIDDYLLKYGIMSGVTIISFVFSYFQLDKKMDVKELINKILRRKK